MLRTYLRRSRWGTILFHSTTHGEESLPLLLSCQVTINMEYTWTDRLVNKHLRLNAIVRGNWFLSSSLTASKAPGHMGTMSSLIPLKNSVTFFSHHLKTETVLGWQLSALLCDVQGLIKETHQKGNHMNDKNKQKGFGGEGPLYI